MSFFSFVLFEEASDGVLLYFKLFWSQGFKSQVL